MGVCEGEVDSGDCMASHGLSVPRFSLVRPQRQHSEYFAT